MLISLMLLKPKKRDMKFQNMIVLNVKVIEVETEVCLSFWYENISFRKVHKVDKRAVSI